MKRIVMVLGVMSVLVAQALSVSNNEKLANFAKINLSEVQTSSDKLDVDQKTGWITMSGNAIVKSGLFELHADKIRIHSESGDAQASGNVTLQQSGFASWSGDYIEVNFKTGAGLATAGEFRCKDFRIRASEVTRTEDGYYDAKHLRITTCTNDVDHWHWCMSGHGRFKDNESAEIWSAVPYLFGVPFAYLPYWYRDLDAGYGLRSVPGYTSRWGGFLLNTYKYNLYSSPYAAGSKLDAETQVDYRTSRGVGVGETFSWDLKERGQGSISAYYAYDQDKPDDLENRNWYSPIHNDRYAFTLKHEADLSPRDQFLLNGTFLSDSEVAREFFTRRSRMDSTPMNFASVEHREHELAAGVTVSGPINEFYSGTQRLPEGWLNVVPLSVWDTGFIYESQTRAGYLQRKYAELDNADWKYHYYPGDWADYDTARVDTGHRLTYPVKFGDVVSWVPRAGYRGTYYSSAAGDVEDLFRQSADFGFELSTRATADIAQGWRHVIEPYVDYSYQPTDYYGDSESLYLFDRRDRLYEWIDQFGRDGFWVPYTWHGVRPGVRNLLQTTDDETNRIRTFLDWDTYVAYQMESGGPIEDHGVRMTGTKVVLSPTRKLDVRGVTEWDNTESQIAYTDIGAFYRMTERFRLGGGYLFRDHSIYDYGVPLVDEWSYADKELLYGGFTHTINTDWEWSLFARQDLRETALDELGGYVQYSLDCLVFQFRVSWWPSYEREDGTERDEDVRVMLLMWLKAESREPKDDWLRW